MITKTDNAKIELSDVILNTENIFGIAQGFSKTSEPKALYCNIINLRYEIFVNFKIHETSYDINAALRTYNKI